MSALEITGLADVVARLQDVPIHLRKKVMYGVLRKAAQPIVRAARANAPVARKSTARVIPGLLRKSITVSISKFQKPAAGNFGVYVEPRIPGKVKSLQRRARKGGAAGPNFGDPYYYKFQEFGFHATGRRRIAGGQRRRAIARASGQFRKVPGLQFLGRAYESQRNAVVASLNDDLVAAVVARFESKGAR